MELRIDINNRRKQFASIDRDDLCDFQDGVKYQSPYSARNRQLESTRGDITEECHKSLMGFKSLHRVKYVVLHHGQREASDLSREVYALKLADMGRVSTVADLTQRPGRLN